MSHLTNDFLKGESDRRFWCIGTWWLTLANELPDDALDRLVHDPHRPGAGDEIRDMGDET